MTEQELIYEIINKALEERAFPFRHIVCWEEFIYYHKWLRSTRMVIKVLASSAKKLFKSYCRDIIAGTSEGTKLLAYRQLLDVIDFYETDLATVQSMIDEYDEYLGNFGNFINALFGKRREL